MKRRYLLVAALLLTTTFGAVAAVLYSNTIRYTFTARQVTITRNPSAPSELVIGQTDNVTVTVHTPTPFTGTLRIFVANATSNAQPCWVIGRGGCDDFAV